MPVRAEQAKVQDVLSNSSSGTSTPGWTVSQ